MTTIPNVGHNFQKEWNSPQVQSKVPAGSDCINATVTGKNEGFRQVPGNHQSQDENVIARLGDSMVTADDSAIREHSLDATKLGDEP
jgi:hypothetical protein